MTKKVKKVSVYLSLLLIPFGAAAVGIAGKATRTRQVDPASASQQTDAAFRDGFYLGKLDARDGRRVRPSIGRWSDSKDRALFLAGYQRGYEEARAAKIAGQRQQSLAVGEMREFPVVSKKGMLRLEERRLNAPFVGIVQARRILASGAKTDKLHL